MRFELKVLRSKKTGDYFKWVQRHHDIGDGVYEACIHATDMRYGDCPDIFDLNTQLDKDLETMLKDHKLDEVEFVPFFIEIGDEE